MLICYCTADCPNTKYGLDCDKDCACNFTNTISCDSLNGSCNCKPGWAGVQCDTDIQECTINSTICGDNAECHEMPGSYQCVCNAGYMMDSNNSCKGLCLDGLIASGKTNKMWLHP